MENVLFTSPLNLLWVIVSLFIIIIVVYIAKLKFWEKRGLGKTALFALTTLYSALVVSSVVAATKIIKFNIPVLCLLFPEGMFVPAGVIVYAASFLITDLISEVYGKKEAFRAVILGFVSMLIFAGYSILMVKWDYAPYWTGQESYESVVYSSFRITIAGIVSFIISQSLDVTVFHWLKNEKTKIGNRNNLWIRNNVSTITSQFIDSTIFIAIAYLGIYDSILNMILAQWLIKVIIALIDTPFAYWGRSILTKDSL